MNHNQNWPRIANHLDGILITVGSGFGKTNGLLNLSKHQQADLNKLYLHVNDPFESKYQLLIDEREKVGIKHKKKPRGIYWLLTKKWSCLLPFRRLWPNKGKILLTVFDDKIVDMEGNKNIIPLVI